MSIIEKAAGKLGTNYQTQPAQAPLAGGDAERERALIEESIERAAASFGELPTRGVRRTRAAEDEGPPTIWGGTSRRVNVDLRRLKAMGMVTPDAGRDRIAEEFRLIKRPLLAKAFGHGDTPRIPRGNLIMITSSLPGEGKTFTAVNLAISMASEMENTVLLVDADVAKAAIPRYLGFDAGDGLIDVLRNPRLPLSDVLVKTDIAKLTVLPAGNPVPHATELLASSAMQAFVEDIANRYPDRIILFDSPPLLATSEATVLASYMGQIVFVVEAERTPQEALKDALAHIANQEHIGLVLNKTTHAPVGDYYGYGYGYGYGEYGR